jgi:hypothetical protein
VESPGQVGARRRAGPGLIRPEKGGVGAGPFWPAWTLALSLVFLEETYLDVIRWLPRQAAPAPGRPAESRLLACRT